MLTEWTMKNDVSPEDLFNLTAKIIPIDKVMFIGDKRSNETEYALTKTLNNHRSSLLIKYRYPWTTEIPKSLSLLYQRCRDEGRLVYRHSRDGESYIGRTSKSIKYADRRHITYPRRWLQRSSSSPRECSHWNPCSWFAGDSMRVKLALYHGTEPNNVCLSHR